MKAVYIERFGGPEVLIYGDLADPVAAPGEVVVNVFATSFNAADWKGTPRAVQANEVSIGARAGFLRHRQCRW